MKRPQVCVGNLHSADRRVSALMTQQVFTEHELRIPPASARLYLKPKAKSVQIRRVQAQDTLLLFLLLLLEKSTNCELYKQYLYFTLYNTSVYVAWIKIRYFKICLGS